MEGKQAQFRKVLCISKIIFPSHYSLIVLGLLTVKYVKNLK